MRNVRLHQSEEEGIVDMCTEAGKVKENISEGMERAASEHSSLVGLNDAADEFFDVPEPTDYDQSEDGWTSDFAPEAYSQACVKVIIIVFYMQINLQLMVLYLKEDVTNYRVSPFLKISFHLAVLPVVVALNEAITICVSCFALI